ncbi:DUF1488 domain-containing protein [Vibrio albus]|jgi:hypothetical protein|uniref:DUF1488 domain-containing protein n=1 Tax=Vibrio albus TaxID=2200953 RepID=A0A2U3B537_9VIBR|nr:DUF1488 domain-containing protein [Vibrio albus]PWI31834.1 DUF1488 domain-containing protein [Vibrio albus]
MNQSILFPDIQDWNEEKQVIIFPAQQAGALIECVISLGKLTQLAGKEISSGEEALQQFNVLRFDIEELAEERIEEEEFNSAGQVEL